MAEEKPDRGVEARPAVRRIMLNVRVSALERADIERAAKKRGLTVSEYLRWAHSVAREAK